MTTIAVLLAPLCFGCADRAPTMAVPEHRVHLSAVYDCSADRRDGTVTCRDRERAGTGAGSRALLGQNQIKMSSANLKYDSLTYIMSFDATVQNLLSHAIGTPDGTERTGVKVYFDAGPIAAAYNPGYDTGTVYVKNPDGVQAFTRPDQPYFLYDTILAPQATAAMKRWEYRVPRSVARVTFSVRAFTFTPPEDEIPMNPPSGFLISADSVAKLYSRQNTVYYHKRSNGPYPRHIVRVAFHSHAGREERQSALNAVNARVIGGDGIAYYFGLRGSVTADTLWAAIDKLAKLPQVRIAGAELFTQGIAPAHRRPHDGPGWRKRDWNVKVDSATGPNWALEAVAAPFAWGCSTGEQTTEVAVIDTEHSHSRWVQSVIAAPANDSTETTGLMWKGDVQPLVGGLAASLNAAFADSADVMNLSLSVFFADTLQTDSLGNHPARLPVMSDSGDIQRARDFAAAFRDVLLANEQAFGWRPLYIVAAGNYQMDASLSALPQLRTDAALGDRVLVVSGADSVVAAPGVRALWANSGDPVNRGSNTSPTLVDIAAPGANLQVYDNGLALSLSGTSFAAPHVAGAAGLLKSFDPALTSTEIRDLILAGAVQGGWSAGGKPFLNIHESLRAASRRPGAPLCGQRFWIENGTFRLQRDSASAAAEPLFVLGYSGAQANILHGGKQINLYRRGGGATFRWNQVTRTWAQSALDSSRYPQPGSNGTWLSSDAMSHDGDSVIVVSKRVTPSAAIFEFEWAAFNDSSSAALNHFANLPITRSQGPSDCIQRYVSVHPDSHDSLMAGSDSIVAVYNAWLDYKQREPCELYAEPQSAREPSIWVSYSPRGEAAYAFISHTVSTTSVGGGVPCGKVGQFSAPGRGLFPARVNMECFSWSTSRAGAGSEVWRISIPSGASHQVAWTSSDREIRHPSIRENIREVLVQTATRSAAGTGQWVRQGDYEWAVRNTASTQVTGCRLEFRDLQTGTVTFAPPVQCRDEGGDAGIAPSRTPSK